MSKSQDKRIAAQTQPDWVCLPCGNKYRGRANLDGHTVTVHDGVCGVCGQFRAVCSPRDFGYLRPEWNAA